jgi:hypothetical protein
VEVAETRNYGATANDKAMKLIQKLMFATASVVALVFIALGRREAAIVGGRHPDAHRHAVRVLGLGLHAEPGIAVRPDLSIGILVDDAIVVVENIHRHTPCTRTRPWSNSSRRGRRGGRAHHPGHAHRHRRAAADGLRGGLMGPYMSPIPINASWACCCRWRLPSSSRPGWRACAQAHGHGSDASHGLAAKLGPLFERVFRPLLDEAQGSRNRRWLGAGTRP